jgi:hypothetical protein
MNRRKERSQDMNLFAAIVILTCCLGVGLAVNLLHPWKALGAGLISFVLMGICFLWGFSKGAKRRREGSRGIGMSD